MFILLRKCIPYLIVAGVENTNVSVQVVEKNIAYREITLHEKLLKIFY